MPSSGAGRQAGVPVAVRGEPPVPRPAEMLATGVDSGPGRLPSSAMADGCAVGTWITLTARVGLASTAAGGRAMLISNRLLLTTSTTANAPARLPTQFQVGRAAARWGR